MLVRVQILREWMRATFLWSIREASSRAMAEYSRQRGLSGVKVRTCFMRSS